MPVIFDDTTDAENLHSLQGKVAELASTTEAMFDQQHTANGEHTDITVDSVTARTPGAIVPIEAGVAWMAGPELVGAGAVISPPALTTDTHDWAPSGIETARVVEITATVPLRLTGIAVSGPLREVRRTLTLVNRSAVDLTLPSESSESSGPHRLYFGGESYLFRRGTTLDLYYDPQQPLWRGPQVTGTRSSTLVHYSFSAAQIEPPGADQIRFNAGYPYTAVTTLWLRNVSADGQDVYLGLLATPVGSVILVQDKNDHTQYARFQIIAAPIDKTTYVEFPVVHVAHGSSLGGGQLVLVQNVGAAAGAPVGHHVSHEPGGTDALVGAAWLNVGNVFTQPQYIRSGNPSLYLLDTTQPANTSQYRIMAQGQMLIVYGQHDGEAGYVNIASFNKAANAMTVANALSVGNAITVNGGGWGAGNSLHVAAAGGLALFGDRGVIQSWPADAIGGTFLTHNSAHHGGFGWKNLYDAGTSLVRAGAGLITLHVNTSPGAAGTAYSPTERFRVDTAGASVTGNLSITGSLTGGTIPDARLSANVALKSPANVFSGGEHVFQGTGTAGINVHELSYNAAFRLISYANAFHVYENTAGSLLNVDRSGNLAILGTMVSGHVPDARLSANVLKHAGGYPGGTTTFLRGDGAFAATAGGAAEATGTWAPYLRGESGETGTVYAQRTGTYVKVGRQVTAQFSIGVTTWGSQSGALVIDDLPFQSDEGYYSCTMYWAGLTVGVTTVVGLVFPWNQRMHLYAANGPLTAVQQMNAVNIGPGVWLHGSVTYRSAS